MKYLLILMLLSTIARGQQVNYYKQGFINKECKKQAIIGMGLVATTFIVQYNVNSIIDKNKVLYIGIALNITNILIFEKRKHNIKNRFRSIKLKNR